MSPVPPIEPRDYNIFDFEEDDVDEDEVDGSNVDKEPIIYSDFQTLESSDSDDDSCDIPYSFEMPNFSYHDDVNFSEEVINIVLDHERQEEVSVAPAMFPCFV